MRLTTIKASHLDLTPSIRAYVEKKIEPLARLTKRDGEAAEIMVELERTSKHHAKGPVFRCEWRAAVPGGLLYADAVGEDLFEAIDLAQQELRRQLAERKRARLERRTVSIDVMPATA